MDGEALTRTGYPTPSRWLHWLTALVVLATIPVGAVMNRDDISRDLQNTLFIFHKNVGVVILVLVALRLLVRATTTTPPLPASLPAWQRQAAAISHGALYLLLIVMAVSGYVRVVAGGFPIEGLDALGIPPLVPRSDTLAENAQWVHFNVRFVLVAFIILHIAAAIQHAVIKRDGVFARMWPLMARKE